MCEHGRHHGNQDCGCEEGSHGRHQHGHHEGHHEGRCGGGMGFGPGMGFARRFPTQEERIARLEEYLKSLQAEAKGVEEQIVRLRAMA